MEVPRPRIWVSSQSGVKSENCAWSRPALKPSQHKVWEMTKFWGNWHWTWLLFIAFLEYSSWAQNQSLIRNRLTSRDLDIVVIFVIIWFWFGTISDTSHLLGSSLLWLWKQFPSDAAWHSGLDFQLQYLLPPRPWTNYLTSLSSNFSLEK